MPPKPCPHTHISVTPLGGTSPFKPRTHLQRLNATSPTGRATKSQIAASTTPEHHLTTFPLPLVLPGDELSHDPKYPPQSVRAWLADEERNVVDGVRNVIYVADVPLIGEGLGFLREWGGPRGGGDDDGARGGSCSGSKSGHGGSRTASRSKHATRETKSASSSSSKSNKREKPAPAASATTLSFPNVDEVTEYLTAFFHGLPVRALPTQLEFVPWNDEEEAANNDTDVLEMIGLKLSPQDILGVRSRIAPPNASAISDGTQTHQLNLTDLLEAAMEILPPNSYALLLLLEQDLYEDPTDDFCCGRAYGGSRVAVVSGYRYNPLLDDHVRDHDQEYESWETTPPPPTPPMSRAQLLNQNHAWPSSHCASYIQSLHPSTTTPPNTTPPTTTHTGALRPAIISGSRNHAHSPIQNSLSPSLPHPKHALWLSRVVKTASHELAHCMGLDHCVYYACVMQGTGGLMEDERQPPYLCPVCLRKLGLGISPLYAGMGKGGEEEGGKEEGDEWVRARYEALRRVCERWLDCGEDGRVVPMWAGFGGWIRGRLLGMI